MALPCLLPPAICLQATSQRPAMAYPFPFPSRLCLRPASLSPWVASGLPRPPASQPRPARGNPRPFLRSMRSRPCPEASQPARSRRSSQPAPEATARRPTEGQQEAIEATSRRSRPASRRPRQRRRPKYGCKKHVKKPYCKFFASRNPCKNPFLQLGFITGSGGAGFFWIFLYFEKSFSGAANLRIFA